MLGLEKGAKKGAFFRPCAAQSRGGGGAPPTTLILLRNQVNARVAAARPTAGTAATVRGLSGGLSGGT